ncbi:MAG: hypothetical protein JST30_05230 [Armatimonadetes bacterium]|nr:hypothetical protein [Armatimonadota bacterium]
MKGLTLVLGLALLAGCSSQPEPAAQQPPVKPDPVKSGDGPAPTKSGGEIQMNPNAGKVNQPGSALNNR